MANGFSARPFPILIAARSRRSNRPTGDLSCRLKTATCLHVRAVIVAMGLANQAFKPEEFAGLPAELVSHTCEHPSLRHFQGQSVAVVGRGQSACESAVLMKEIGADVEMICRGDIHWLGGGAAPGRDKPMDRLRESHHRAVGGRSVSAQLDGGSAGRRPSVSAPAAQPVHQPQPEGRGGGVAAGPLRRRERQSRTNHPGRAARGRSYPGAIGQRHGRATTTFCSPPAIASTSPSSAFLLRDCCGTSGAMTARPVWPRASSSSVRGLYFVGSSAVSSFGPLMRFIAGSGYAARSVTRSILAARAQVRRRSAAKVAPRPETISGEAVQQP